MLIGLCVSVNARSAARLLVHAYTVHATDSLAKLTAGRWLDTNLELSFRFSFGSQSCTSQEVCVCMVGLK